MRPLLMTATVVFLILGIMFSLAYVHESCKIKGGHLISSSQGYVCLRVEVLK